MKKGQSGVSLIALVITIIVVIILAAVAFGTSTRTITNANWSTFTNAVGEVRTALQERVTTVKGEEAAKGTTRSDAQVYNWVSKSGDTANWLSSFYADNVSATRIEPDVIKNTLGLKNLNTIKVNTPLATNREVSYFVTNKGDVFVWPPYEYEGKMYVNETTVVAETENTLPTGNITVGGVDVYLGTTVKTESVNIDIGGKAAADIQKVPTVYYVDSSSAAMPRGLESDVQYNESTNVGA